LGWGSSSTITSLLGTNDLLISEVAPAAGTYYLSIGSSSSGNSDANPITATSLGQVIQWRVSNPSASDVYWFNATNTLATASNGVPSDGVGPIGFSAVAVPEPTSLALVIGSAAGLLLIGRRKELRSR
jgi:hypothetical protein